MILIAFGLVLLSILFVCIGKLLQYNYLLPQIENKQNIAFCLFSFSYILPWLFLWDGWQTYGQVKYEVLGKLALFILITYGSVIGTTLLIGYWYSRTSRRYLGINEYVLTASVRYTYLSLIISGLIYSGITPNPFIFLTLIPGALLYLLNFTGIIKDVSRKYLDTIFTSTYHGWMISLITFVLLNKAPIT